MTDVCPTHRIRSDWRRHRRGLNIIDPPLGDDFALGGIAAQALPLDARIVILSTEPLDADRVALNAAAAKWLGETAPTESTVPVFGWGHSTSATSTALVHGSWSNDDREWDRYIALRRHGGLEAGLTRAAWSGRQGRRVFSLRYLVAAMWSIADLQVAAAAKWAIDGPWEISLALRDTAGAALGDFAEGWAPFGDFRNDGTGCGEPHVLHRWTVDEIELQALAFGAGDRIENSFGTTHQRYLAHRGSYEGQFDPCSVG